MGVGGAVGSEAKAMMGKTGGARASLTDSSPQPAERRLGA